MDITSFTQMAVHYSGTYKAPVSRAEATINKKTEYGFLQRTLDRYQKAMAGQGWMTTDQVGKLAGSDKWAAKDMLKRMLDAGLVELDDKAKNKAGRPLYQWRWL